MQDENWKEFREAGLLWFVNSILHCFGWAIVVKEQDGTISDVRPEKVKYRGFDDDSEPRKWLSRWFAKNAAFNHQQAYPEDSIGPIPRNDT